MFRMILRVHTDQETIPVGEAFYPAIPRVGEEIALAPIKEPRVAQEMIACRYLVERVVYRMHNLLPVAGWNYPYIDGREAEVELFLHAADEETRHYLNRLLVHMGQHEQEKEG